MLGTSDLISEWFIRSKKIPCLWASAIIANLVLNAPNTLPSIAKWWQVGLPNVVTVIVVLGLGLGLVLVILIYSKAKVGFSK